MSNRRNTVLTLLIEDRTAFIEDNFIAFCKRFLPHKVGYLKQYTIEHIGFGRHVFKMLMHDQHGKEGTVMVRIEEVMLWMAQHDDLDKGLQITVGPKMDNIIRGYGEAIQLLSDLHTCAEVNDTDAIESIEHHIQQFNRLVKDGDT